jgi:acyl dehydratase
MGADGATVGSAPVQAGHRCSAAGEGRRRSPPRTTTAGGRADPSTSGAGEQMQFGRYYEEFEVGAVYKHWPGKTVTEYDDHLFCLLTMNHHPLHLDTHYAEETTQFGRNVVVGNYVYSLVLGMSVPDISGKAIANLEVESLRHVAPTFHGDTLYAETRVLEKWESTSKDDRGVVHVESIGYNQDGRVVCIFRRKVMVPKQSYLQARGGDQPGRPSPQPDKNWSGPSLEDG